jgi:hypothetical protein
MARKDGAAGLPLSGPEKNVLAEAVDAPVPPCAMLTGVVSEIVAFVVPVIVTPVPWVKRLAIASHAGFALDPWVVRTSPEVVGLSHAPEVPLSYATPPWAADATELIGILYWATAAGPSSSAASLKASVSLRADCHG